MPIYDLYSRRKRHETQSEPDVYQYDEIPEALHVQVQRIFEDSIGPYDLHSYRNNNEAWCFIREAISREIGKLTFAGKRSPFDDCIAFLHSEQNVEQWLNLVEFGMRVIAAQTNYDDYERDKRGITQPPQDAVKEFNFRFLEAGLGYQFENNQIIRVDSQLIHSEVVRPALHLLSDPDFNGPQEEFLAAHAHYRSGEYKDCVVDACNAFESTLKTICALKEWNYNKGARASDLLKVVRHEGLLPDYMDGAFEQLAATLKSGLPAVRNAVGSHGQGATPVKTADHVAAYALHLAAAQIVFLVNAYQETKH